MGLNKYYTYCISDECIHRRGCKRNLENYSEEKVKALYTENRFVSEIDCSECIPNLDDVECTNNYQFLDRFRNSDGSEMK